MARPSTVPRWADVGGGAGGIGGNEPASGRKDTGFFYSEQPVPSWFNWLFWVIYTWILWLRDEVATRTAQVAPKTAWRDGSGGSWSLTGSASGYVTDWASNASQVASEYLVIPVSADVADQITGFSLHCRHTGTATAGTIRCRLVRINSAGTETLIGSDADSAATTSLQTIVVTGLTETVPSDATYFIRVHGAAGGTTPRLVSHVTVNVSVRP